MGSPAQGINVGPPDAGSRFIGVQKEILVPAPAAGAEWSYKIDGGTWQRIQLAHARLITSAAVANRFPGVMILDPDGNRVYSWQPGTSYPASTTANLCLVPGIAQLGSPGSGRAVMPIPFFWLPAGWSIGSDSISLQAADQYDQLLVVVEELDRGPLGETVGTDLQSSI